MAPFTLNNSDSDSANSKLPLTGSKEIYDKYFREYSNTYATLSLK